MQFKIENGIYINDESIEFLSDLIDLIDELKDIWNTNQIWFRGVSDEKYKLIPSIYREEVWEYYNKKAIWLYSEFKRRSKQFDNFQNKSFWEYYHAMQHYGTPTRLLDWTSGSFIALFFALSSYDLNNPVIWVITPFELNKRTSTKSGIFYSDKYNKKKLVDKYLFDNEELPEKPIAILPNFSNNRIVAQKSCFTIHGKDKLSIDEFLRDEKKPMIAKIVIDENADEELIQEVVTAGISYSNLFPDLDGLSKELRFEFGMK